MAMVQILMPRDINFRIISLSTEVTNANAFLGVFLPLFLIMAAILLLTFMRRHILENKQDIRILRSLGYSNTELSFALLLFPALVASFVLIGYGLGILLSMQLFDVYSARYLYPKADFQLYGDIAFKAVVLPLFGLLVTSFLYIRLVVGRIGHPRNRPRIWQRLVSIRTIVQSSLLWFVIGVLLLFGLNGNRIFTDFVNYTKTGNHYQEMIHLRYLTNSNHLDTYETYTKSPISIVGVNGEVLKTVTRSTLYGIAPDTTLKRLIDDDIHNNQLLEDGIIISDFLHTALNIDAGDTIVLEIGAITHEAPIMGVSNELLENNIYMDQATLNSYFGLDETYYNGLFTTDYEYSSPDIVSRIDYVSSLDEFSSVLEVSSRIVQFLVVLSLLLGLYMTALILISHFMDHLRDIALLRSLGYTNMEIHRRYTLPIYLVMLVCFLLAVPATQWLLDTLLDALMETIGFKLVVRLRWTLIGVGFLSIHLVFAIVIERATRFFDGIAIAQTLKRNPTTE
jgi:putative ABC transport system permease protein